MNNAGSNARSNAELNDLIPLHALGALEPDEVSFLEAYLLVNPEARASYVWYLEAVSVLARSVPLLEPAVDLKARMLDRVRQDNAGQVCSARDYSARNYSARVDSSRVDLFQAGTGTARGHVDGTNMLNKSPVPMIAEHTRARTVRNPLLKLRFVPIAFAAMAAIVVGLLVQNRQLEGTLRLLETSRHHLEFLLSSNQTKTVVLNSADGKTVVGVVLAASDGGVLISHTMGDLSGTKTWQAWYILKGETMPRSLGITNASHLMIHVPVNTHAIAVSEEPAGGSLSPTTVRAIATL
jgi:anti-sigma-K factor RskA